MIEIAAMSVACLAAGVGIGIFGAASRARYWGIRAVGAALVVALFAAGMLQGFTGWPYCLLGMIVGYGVAWFITNRRLPATAINITVGPDGKPEPPPSR